MASVFLVCSLLQTRGAAAQDLEPRNYANIPTGMNFLVPGYAVTDGSVLFDPSIAFENAEISIDGPFLGYARALALGGMSGKIDALMGRACLSGSADYQGERVTRDVCGWTDSRLRMSVNFIGAPALSLQEIAGYRQDLVVGASLQLSVPTGDYDPARLVNIGTNRWAAKAEIGASKSLRPWTLELALAGTFYEDNDEFYGGQTREQDIVYSFQTHLVREFNSGIWAALNATYYRGGQTTTGNTVNDNMLSNTRVGLTVAFPVNRKHSIKITASSGVSTRIGGDFDHLIAAWQYRWGGGL